MVYTYLFALILFSIALYIAEHLYFKDGNKMHHITIYHLIPFMIMLILPYINICAGIFTILGVITKNYHYVEYYYTGIFKKQITKLINNYNDFLWLK